jgi:hypothetical protein
MAGILNGLSSLVRTPEIAVIAAQGVQAGELAARQGLASIQRDAQHREHMISGMDASDATERTGQRLTPLELEERRRKAAERKAGPLKGPAAWPQHRLDITV